MHSNLARCSLSRIILHGSGLALLAFRATAQSIHVDFGPAGSGVPSPTYGASNGLPGVWNAVGASSVSNLRRWDGTPTSVSLTNSNANPGCPSGAFVGSASGPGDDAALCDDQSINASYGPIWTFHGLAPGSYVVDTLVGFQQCGSSSVQTVGVSAAAEPTQFVRGGCAPFLQGSTTWPPPMGSNFARHHVTVSDGTITIFISPEEVHVTENGAVSGIQLDFVGDRDITGTPVCFGDGSAAACPCGNSGQTGIGCQNSAGTGGSWLFASGSANPDTIVLHASGELPNALSVFLQGNVTIPPVFYGDGLRCAGGTLRRLYTKGAHSGVVFAPGSGDPSITVQSANLGVPISPGGRRYYQVYYRDANAGFCPPPQGNTFNVSNAVKIDW